MFFCVCRTFSSFLGVASGGVTRVSCDFTALCRLLHLRWFGYVLGVVCLFLGLAFAPLGTMLPLLSFLGSVMHRFAVLPYLIWKCRRRGIHKTSAEKTTSIKIRELRTCKDTARFSHVVNIHRCGIKIIRKNIKNREKLGFFLIRKGYK